MIISEKNSYHIIGTGYKTLSKLENGVSTLQLNISNDSHVVPVNEGGENYFGCETVLSLQLGDKLITSGVKYEIKPSEGITGNWNEGTRKYTVTKLTEDSAYVDFIATYDGVKRDARFSVTKIYNGNDSVIASLSNDTHAFAADQDGIIKVAQETTTSFTIFKGTNAYEPESIKLPSPFPSGIALRTSGKDVIITAMAGSSLAIYGGFELSATFGGKTYKKQFSWVKTRDGRQGDAGPQGIPGPSGGDGATKYTWVKYADDDRGTNMVDVPTANSKYIGLAHNKSTDEETDDFNDYVWTKFVGDNGIPGAPGADGKTKYTWIKYARDIYGNDMSETPTSGRNYIGIAYNQDDDKESGNPNVYTWSKLNGVPSYLLHIIPYFYL